jgi:hypothetical protein
MNDSVLYNELTYKGYSITTYFIDNGNILYYTSVMELNYLSVSFDVDISIENARLRIDMEYDYNEYS